MRWVVLAIAVFIALYTWINLRYRKPAPLYEPYADGVARQHAAEAGYARITADLEFPADLRVTPGGAGPAEAGLPASLQKVFVRPPLLPAEIGAVSAPVSVDRAAAYAVQFECTVADEHEQLAGAEVFVKAGEILIVPDCERLVPGLTARRRGAAARLVVPPDKLPAGAYRVLLIGRGSSRAWALQVH